MIGFCLSSSPKAAKTAFGLFIINHNAILRNSVFKAAGLSIKTYQPGFSIKPFI